MQRNHQVAFDTRNSRFRRIFPLQEPVADIAGGNKLVADHDFIAVRIMEISRGSLPAVFVELKANLFIDAGFRFQIAIAHVVAADTVRRIERTALTACVQDKVRIGLIQVWRFVRAGNTAFDQPVFADLMREVQSRTPVAAAVAVVVEADGRNQMGFVGQRNIVFNVGSPVALRSLTAARCGDTVKRIGFTLIFKSLSIGSRIIQFAVGKFRTDRQHVINTKFKRNIRFAAETQVFQTALNKIQACIAAFWTTCQTFR